MRASLQTRARALQSIKLAQRRFSIRLEEEGGEVSADDDEDTGKEEDNNGPSRGEIMRHIRAYKVISQLTLKHEITNLDSITH